MENDLRSLHLVAPQWHLRPHSDVVLPVAGGPVMIISTGAVAGFCFKRSPWLDVAALDRRSQVAEDTRQIGPLVMSVQAARVGEYPKRCIA